MVFTVLGSLFSRPATIKYPYQPFRMPDKFRGPPKWDSDRCIGCKLCMRDCPSGAITIWRAEDPVPAVEGAKKRFNQTVDLGRCVYCGQCADTCPRKVITMTSEFELAQIVKDNFKVTYHASQPQPAAPAAPTDAPSGGTEKSAGNPGT
jgi:formate hydrogenlyase subunit 6/NADH:ubiquinone oxidoreductase subunit I